MERNPVSDRQFPAKREVRQDRSGAIWLVQAFSGLLLIPLLALHMIAHHFVVEGGLRDFDQVVDYISNPAIFFTTVVFLIVVTIHAAFGIRAILIDLRPSPSARRILDWALIAFSVLAIAYGIWLEITIARM